MEFSIAQSHETGALNVFMIHFVALFRKKFFVYKRNIKGFLVEVFVPVLMVLIGLGLSKITFYLDSPERTL